MSIKSPLCLLAVVESHHRNVDICAVENPLAVTYREENISAFLDALEDFTICAAADGLRGEQARALAFARRDLLACLLEPVAAQVGSWGNATLVQIE